jgi:peptidyl-prolyl cis-trans isomerase SurA
MKDEIKGKVLKDSRAEQTKKSFVEKLKKEYSYAIDKVELNKLIETANSNVFKGSFDLSRKSMDQALIRMKGENITVGDFNDHLRSIGMLDRTISPGDYVLNSAMKFGEEKLLQLEDAKLEGKYEPFRVLMKEYYEGILLFEISEQMVFSRAVNDASGLMTFYNLNKVKFMWPERADVVIYKCANADIARKVRRMAKEGMEQSDIIRELNLGAQVNCQVQEGIYSKDDNLLLSKIPWRLGLCEDVIDHDQVFVVQFKEILAPSVKSMEEARELITSEYQEFLEREWIRSLRSQHTFTVNKDLLHTVK